MSPRRKKSRKQNKRNLSDWQKLVKKITKTQKLSYKEGLIRASKIWKKNKIIREYKACVKNFKFSLRKTHKTKKNTKKIQQIKSLNDKIAKILTTIR